MLPQTQGAWRGGARIVVDHHLVHAMADGGDARDGPWQAIRPLPRAGTACVWRKARALDHRPAAADRGGRHRHRVHGHRRQVHQEVPRHHLPRLQEHQAFLLHHDLRLRAVCSLSASRLQLHLRRVLGRRCHVPQVPTSS